jgi:micrococcal nuclease
MRAGAVVFRFGFVGAAAALLAVGGCASGSAGSDGPDPIEGSVTRSPSVPLPQGADATVTRVVDGDTIMVRLDGRDTTVRLIGVDTPETKDPRKPVQCFGREASARTKALLPEGTAVRIAYDVERNDRYGRTLGYVYRRDTNRDGNRDRDATGSFVNAALVRDGFASVYTYPPNVAHADEFVALQREARDAGRGLWGACPVTPAPTTPSAPPGAANPCDPAYPDVCIPPPPPDLDCGDVADRSFRVLAPDPHRFDSNGDGVGCEGVLAGR